MSIVTTWEPEIDPGMRNDFKTETRISELDIEGLDTDGLKGLIQYIPDDLCPRFYLSGRGEDDTEVLGVGTLVNFNMPDSFKRMDQLLETNPDLVFMGGLPFDETQPLTGKWSGFAKTQMFLPSLVIELQDGVYTLRQNRITGGTYSNLDFLKLIEAQKTQDTVEQNSLINTVLEPSEEEWSSEVRGILDRIGSGQYDKIVLSRTETHQYERPLDSARIFSNFQKQPHSYNCLYQLDPKTGFISATPERLFKLAKGIIEIDALAGTRPIGGSEEETIENAEELLASKKDRREFEFVKDFVEERLGKLATGTSGSELRVLRLNSLLHLHRAFRGQLNDGVSVADVIKTLHPTPAVGSSPPDAILENLGKIEQHQRGFYAGPIGFYGSGRAEFAVAIRSALISHNEITYYAGAGIVEGSIPDEESRETQRKLASIADAVKV